MPQIFDDLFDMQCNDRFIFNNEYARTKRIFDGASGSDNMAVYVEFRNAQYCGHYMADALRETGDLSKLKKASIVAAVSALSLGLGVLMFLYQGDVPSDMGIVRSAFILISTLTVPHFILEHLMTYKNHNAP